MTRGTRRIGSRPEGGASITSLEEVRHRHAPWARRGRQLLRLMLARGTAVLLLVLAATLVLGGVLWRYDQWKTALGLRREVLERYLIYMNLTWEEYNVAYPLAAAPQQELTYDRYKKAVEDVNAVRSRRLEAFAHLQALAISLRAFPGESTGEIEYALYQSDVRANELSEMIDGWLRDSYCMRADCANSRGNIRDAKYPRFEELMKIRSALQEARKKDSEVVELLKSRF